MKSKFGIFVIIILIVLSGNKNFGQEFDDKTVARVGDIKITAEEFLQRYELTPTVRKQNTGVRKSSKLEFLYTLVAEKLWALEAQNKMLDFSDVIEFSTEQFEKMFVRDALFHKEIKNKVTVTEEEVIEGLIRNANELKVNFLFSEDKNEIENLFNLLEKGIPFDSILVEREEFNEQIEPVEVVFGQMDTEVEEALYNLNVGDYTHPIFTPDGWYIFKLENKIEQMINTNREKEEARNSVVKIIEARKINKLYDKYFKDFFEDKEINVNAQLFKSLSKKISKIFEEKYQLYPNPNQELFSLSADDVLKIEECFGTDSLQINYIQLASDPITLKDFIRIIAFDGFSTKSYELNKVRGLLDYKTQTIIERELLAREGYEQGLHKLPEVQKQVEMWRQNYLYQVLKNQFLDSVKVSEGEIKKVYNKRNEAESYPALINIQEILLDDLETVEYVLNEIDKGTEFKKLVMDFTQREWMKNNNGETGFIPVSRLGEIGKIAYEMEIGEIYGPLQTEKGYSIFKLINKEDEKIVLPKPIEKVKDDIEREIKFKKLNYKISQYTANLALKYGVGINSELLNSIEVTDINSFGFRNLGFGGRITAAPLISPNNNWVETWLNKLTVNP